MDQKLRKRIHDASVAINAGLHISNTQFRKIVLAVHEAMEAAPAGEEGEMVPMFDGYSLPRWLVDAAERIERYMAANHPGEWAIGGIQSRTVPTSIAPAAPAGEVVAKRPPRHVAELLVAGFLAGELGHVPPHELIEDGDDGWAFWVTEEGAEDDTTSYLHHDLRVEWYGTSAPQPASAAQGFDAEVVESLPRWRTAGPRTNGGMYLDPNGGWVKYDDVVALAAAAKGVGK